MSPRQPAQDKKDQADSQPVETVFLVVGKLRRAHGVQGEMVMEVLTDFPERLKPGVVIYAGDEHKPVRLRSTRWKNQDMLVAFEGYQTPEDVGELRNQLVHVKSKDRPALEEGEYYHHQLLGLRVIEENGEFLGVVKEILGTGANDVYVVQPESGAEILLPATDEVVLEINLDKKEMRVHVLPGLKSE